MIATMAVEISTALEPVMHQRSPLRMARPA
jgi:hypothetical protein